MELRALTKSEAALEAGLRADARDEPSFAETAHLLRSAIVFAGAVERGALIERIVTNAAYLGFPATSARARATATLCILEAAGDLASIATDDGTLVLAPPEDCVLTGPDAAVLLGGSASTAPLSSEPGPASVLRPVVDLSGARPLEKALGQPAWRQALLAMGLPLQVDLQEATKLLVEAARIKGELARVTPEGIWGRLDDEGAFGLLEDGREAVFTFDPGGNAHAVCAPEIACWIGLYTWGLKLVTDWPLPRPIPPQLLRALALTGLPKDNGLRRWQLTPDAAATVAAWAGLPDLPDDARARDADQDAVIHASVAARLLVEAPPGCGKTWAACRRVSALVDEGVPPSRIWMISFTRIAVAEIRDRIAGLLREPSNARDIRIVTIDSLAWRLLQGFSEPEAPMPAGHDASVAETLDLLEGGDVRLLDFIGGIEHLVVDEAQDLTGNRSRMVAALISRLPVASGVTVFYDPAQAIYGFSHTATDRALFDRLADTAPSFRRLGLRTDHRTRSAELADLFRSMRRMIIDDSQAPIDRYDLVRSAIEDAAGTAPAIRIGKAAPPGAGAMILFRSRAAVLSASAAYWGEGRNFRVRLTGRAEIVQGWIAALLMSCRRERLDRNDFDGLWQQLAPVPLLSRDTAWSALRRIASAGTSGIDLRRLADRLAASPPPLEVQQTDLGSPTGPLLTTIHGAKGREADEVHLMLPRRPETGSDIDWDEEARVLFVGATRARARLVIGSSITFLGKMPGADRLWQRWTRGGRTGALVEVGLDGDVDQAPPALAEDGTDNIQHLLWKHSWRPVAVRAERGEGAWTLKFDSGPDEGRSIGSLSSAFGKSLRDIAAAAAGPGAWPSSPIRGLYMVAIRTIALPAGEGGPSFWLAPVIAGLPIVWLNSKR